MGREGVKTAALSGSGPIGSDRMARVTARRGAGFIRVCILLVALVVAACAAPSAPSQASHQTVDCAKLAQLGVKTCPPANPPLASPKLTNDTQGQVSSKQFRTLVNAFLRTDAYETFARRTNQPALLKAGILSNGDAVQLSFGDDLQQLAQAASERGQMGIRGPFLTSLRLVTLPTDVQQGISQNGYQPSHLGWIATYSAPADAFIIAGSGFTVLYSASGREPPVDDLDWGVLRTKTALGPIWQYGGGTKCSAAQLWQTFCEAS